MKKMKDILKRKVSVGLVAVMLVSQTPATAFAEETVKQETAEVPVFMQEITAKAAACTSSATAHSKSTVCP